jgi:hypothetical protein
VRFVIVGGPEGEELQRRQLDAIRGVLKSLVDQEQAADRSGDGEG